MRRKVWAFSAAVVIVLAASAPGAQNPRSDTPNGKPFVALQTQIDALDARMTAVETSVEMLDANWRDAEARLDALGAGLQELIEADRALQELISALQRQGEDFEGQLAALRLEVSQKQAAISQACAPGSSIRQVNVTGTVVCEVDDAGTGGGPIVISDFSTDNLTVAAGGTRSAPVFCPSGYRALSGGYIKGTPGEVTVDVPDGNGWRVAVVNQTATSSFVRTVVRCLIQ
jgi:hypothetical protein